MKMTGGNSIKQYLIIKR